MPQLAKGPPTPPNNFTNIHRVLISWIVIYYSYYYMLALEAVKSRLGVNLRALKQVGKLG